MFIQPIITSGLGIKDQTPYYGEASYQTGNNNPKVASALPQPNHKKTSPKIFPLNFLVARQHFPSFFSLNFNLARSRFLIVFYQIKQSLRVMSRKSFLPSKPNRRKKVVTRKTSPAHIRITKRARAKREEALILITPLIRNRRE